MKNFFQNLKNAFAALYYLATVDTAQANFDSSLYSEYRRKYVFLYRVNKLFVPLIFALTLWNVNPEFSNEKRKKLIVWLGEKHDFLPRTLHLIYDIVVIVDNFCRHAADAVGGSLNFLRLTVAAYALLVVLFILKGGRDIRIIFWAASNRGPKDPTSPTPEIGVRPESVSLPGDLESISCVDSRIMFAAQGSTVVFLFIFLLYVKIWLQNLANADVKNTAKAKENAIDAGLLFLFFAASLWIFKTSLKFAFFLKVVIYQLLHIWFPGVEDLLQRYVEALKVVDCNTFLKDVPSLSWLRQKYALLPENLFYTYAYPARLIVAVGAAAIVFLKSYTKKATPILPSEETLNLITGSKNQDPTSLVSEIPVLPEKSAFIPEFEIIRETFSCADSMIRLALQIVFFLLFFKLLFALKTVIQNSTNSYAKAKAEAKEDAIEAGVLFLLFAAPLWIFKTYLKVIFSLGVVRYELLHTLFPGIHYPHRLVEALKGLDCNTLFKDVPSLSWLRQKYALLPENLFYTYIYPARLIIAVGAIAIVFLKSYTKKVTPLLFSEEALNLVNDAHSLVSIQIAAGALSSYLVFTFFLYGLGLFGRVLNRKNFIVTRRTVERRYLGAVTSFVVYRSAASDPRGAIYGLLLVILAACESAVGLGIVLVLHRFGNTINLQDYEELGG